MISKRGGYYMTYEDLLREADANDLITKEKPLKAYNGRIAGKRIAIRKELSEVQKKCVLAEELGHYYTTYGNIINQSSVSDRKQELRARLWAYNKMIGLTGIINAYRHGCRSAYEVAEYLEVTEKFLSEALRQYKSKYGTHAKIDNYIIYFEPALGVLELL
jgi:Zn-dependent peptidase ImmA (M78 family)